MPVEVVDETGEDSAAEADGPAPPESALAAAAGIAAAGILDCLDRSAAELCVMLVDDARMRELNLQWRGKDSTTDVLSFSQLEGEEMHSTAVMLGDVVVSVDVLRRQAADGGWTDEEELTRLILHGVLHLLGFDHEVDEDARAMRAEEGRIVGLLAARGVACAWEEAEA
jgi:probable rRNA maturation factor